MATKENGYAPRIGATYEQIKGLNEQVLASAKSARDTYLEAYENAVDRAVELELTFASFSQQEWLKELIEAQADFTRELTKSYTAAARSILK